MSGYHLQRSIAVSASLDRLYGAVRDFPSWPQWSPWLVVDPSCRIEHADGGIGYAWDGKIAGAGSLSIVAEEAPRRIRYRLAFLRPWKSEAEADFSLAEKAGGTEVTWSMNGSLPFYLFWMKGMLTASLGLDFDRGLAMLKDFAETGGVPSRLEFIGRQALRGFGYVGLPMACSIDEIGQRMQESFARLTEWMEQQDLPRVGAPFSVCEKWNPRKRFTKCTLACPVEEAPAAVPTGFVSGQLPDCQVYSVKHTGPYRHLGNAWAAGMMHARARLFARDQRLHPFEVYESNPREVPEDETVTVVHFPAR